MFVFQMMGCITCYLPRRLGDVVRLYHELFYLCDQGNTRFSLRPLLKSCQSTQSIFTKGVSYILPSFNVGKSQILYVHTLLS